MGDRVFIRRSWLKLSKPLPALLGFLTLISILTILSIDN
jgi:hypothetical protein|tara:strand:+ start:201 stop:317 length:117 start_codon:yes stop_codon:yes gene_type:complete